MKYRKITCGPCEYQPKTPLGPAIQALNEAA